MRGPSWLDTNGSPVFAYHRRNGSRGGAVLVRATYLRNCLAERRLDLIVLHWFERVELTSAHDGPFPRVSVSLADRVSAGLKVEEGPHQREERDLA